MQSREHVYAEVVKEGDKCTANGCKGVVNFDPC